MNLVIEPYTRVRCTICEEWHWITRCDPVELIGGDFGVIEHYMKCVPCLHEEIGYENGMAEGMESHDITKRKLRAALSEVKMFKQLLANATQGEAENV